MDKKKNLEQELDQKEFENDIGQQLRNQELDRASKEKLDSDYHPLALAAVNLLGNLMIGYILFFIVRWFFRHMFGFISGELASGIFLLFHIAIWGMAIIGVVTKKSPWERFLK